MNKEKISIKQRHLYDVISHPKFLNNETLGGEISFFISDYNPKQEIEIEKMIQNLQKKLGLNGIEILVIDLFDLSIEILEEHIGLDNLFSIEKKKRKTKFKRAVQSSLNVHDRLIPSIKNLVEEKKPKILFLKGVGKVFPFIRSHNILNNLQSSVKEIPTVMFFPGVYTGESLELFSLLKDDNYYRAFNISKYNTLV